MRYAVVTAQRHDCVCLFDSKLTDVKTTNTRSGRDFVAEYLEDFRAEGIEAGLYRSIIDWNHPGYSHCGDPHHPQRDDEAWKGRMRDFQRYLDRMRGQVREL